MTAPRTESGEFATTLAGQYALEREIGRGGMGIVYLARDLKLDRLVAIKTLPPHLAGDPLIRERFLREARTAAALSNPSIVPIHRADELNGQVFFVMGYVDGESLAQRIKRVGCLDPSEVLREMRDVALALDYAHRRGVIHRDIKAENILIEKTSGRALVTDFGIARVAEAGPLTTTGQVLGTVYYMSPEQVSGDPVDGRSDLYALGVVAYFALAGRFPFDNALASAVLVAHVTKAPPPLLTVAAAIPHALAEIVDRCLAKEPVARFQTGAELAEALHAAEADVRRNTTAKPIAAAPFLSEGEAGAIWKRAAELQAMTGTRPRPAIIPAPRDHDRDAARASGYTVANVRDAAAEAGIPAQYVDHALAERGLAKIEGIRAAATLDARGKPAPIRRSFGLPIGVSRVVDLPRAPTDREWEQLISEFRTVFDAQGRATTSGGLRQWSHGNLHISVEPTEHGEQLRLSTLNDLAMALNGLGVVTGAMSMLIGAVVAAAGQPRKALVALATFGGMALVAFGANVLRSPRWARERERQMEALAARAVQLLCKA